MSSIQNSSSCFLVHVCTTSKIVYEISHLVDYSTSPSALQSFPKQKRSENQSLHSQPLYPIGGAPLYPSAKQIQSFLDKSKITETDLTVEHVEMLLNVLILDGEIEKVCFRL